MDDITIEVSEFVNNISVTAQPNDQTIDITVTETVETVLLDVSTTVDEVTVTATQNVIVENITVDYVNNENNIDINVTDATQDVTLNITPTLVEINILRSGGEVNILQFDSLADFPTTGSSDYFYLAKDTNKLYRWTGSAYAEISATSSPVWGQIIGTLSEQTDLQNALNLKAPINSPTFTGTVSGITKGMVGLGAVDNTSDLDKPISTATQTALNAKQPLDADLTSIAALSGTFGLLKKTANNSYTIDTNTYLTGITSSDVTTALGYTPENVANKGVNNGYASLDGGGKVPSSQLPSYVDDVIEVSSFSTLPTTGETGKIYITLDTNKIYRWTGSVYVEVSSSATVWGQITGTLSNQTDLQNALNTYYPASNPNGYTSNTGTVTSVALTVPSAFSVSGSPITSSGTLAVTATGNTTQYIAGDGSLVTFPTMSTAGTLIREVRNTTGATLTKGTVVYISGATGNKPTVSKALATGDSTSAQTFGLVQADIANNANGNVVCAGDITGLDTSAFTEGVQLYLSSTTAGTYTTTKQLAPNHLVYIGVVTRAHPTQGQIEVNIQNGYELYELHDVSITSEVNNQGLFYEASTDLWKNKSIATVLGYTPANGADYMALSGDQSIAGNKTFTGFAYFDNTIFLKQTTFISFISGYNSIAASSSGIRMGLTSGISALFDLTSLTTNRDYSLPNASGTLALTSDIPSLAGYVATTGDQSISGNKTFTTSVLANLLKFNESGGFNNVPGYTQIGGTADNFIFINGAGTKQAKFIYNSGGGNDYNLPTGNGTLALTSQLHNAVTIGTANGLSLSTQVLSLGLASTTTTGALSSTDWNTFNNKASTASLANYLPLAGGTLTGALSGTSATFNGVIRSDQTNGLALGSIAGYRRIQFDNSTTTFGFLNDSNALANIAVAGATFSSSVTATQYTAQADSAYYRVRRAAGTDVGYITDSGTWGDSGTDFSIGASSSNLRFYTNNSITPRMTLDASGRLGIGTTAPNRRLSVLVSPSGAGDEGIDVNNGTTRFLFVRTGSSYTYRGVPSSAGMIYSETNISMLSDGGFISYHTSGGERMRITSSGNVGIGTTTPNTQLHLIGSLTVNDIIYLQRSSSSLFLPIANYWNGSGSPLAGTKGDILAIGNAGGDGLVFVNSNTERMRITSGGRLLVGQTSASAASVNGACIFGDTIMTGSFAGVFFENRSGGVTSNANWYGWYATNSTVYLYNGSANIVTITNGGNFSVSGTSTATGFFESSDKTIKTLIEDNYQTKGIESVTAKLYLKNGVEELGYFAQDLQGILPSAVSKGADGLLNLSYREVHTAKIARLEKRVDELEAQLKLV
jgi:hypothetical protein